MCFESRGTGAGPFKTRVWVWVCVLRGMGKGDEVSDIAKSQQGEVWLGGNSVTKGD